MFKVVNVLTREIFEIIDDLVEAIEYALLMEEIYKVKFEAVGK